MKYRMKTKIVEAYQFKPRLGKLAWPEGWLSAPHSIIGDGHCRIWDEQSGLNLDAEDGSWIIKYKDGFHVTSDKAFQQIYEPAE